MHPKFARKSANLYNFEETTNKTRVAVFKSEIIVFNKS